MVLFLTNKIMTVLDVVKASVNVAVCFKLLNFPGPGDSNIVSEKQPLGDDQEMSVSEHGEQHDNVFVNSESNAYTESEIDLKSKGKFVDLNLQTTVSQEMSQISGPDGKSGATPLSQIGFRDPASMGAGQQLTVLSIEVL